MLDRMKYRRQLRRLQSKRERLKKDYDVSIEKASDEKERSSLISESQHSLEDQDRTIEETVRKHLFREAQRLMVPLPAWDDLEAWGDAPWYKGRTLTTKGIDDLRKRIRDERKDRGEITGRRVQMIAVIIAMLTGLLGTIIGILSFLH